MQKNIISALLLLAAIGGISGTIFFKNSADKLSIELFKQKEQNISLLKEHKVVLEENSKLLNKELFRKYMEFLLNIRNKLDKNEPISENDLKHFKDRADFVVENLGILSLSPEESLVYLKYVSTLAEELKKQGKIPTEPLKK